MPRVRNPRTRVRLGGPLRVHSPPTRQVAELFIRSYDANRFVIDFDTGDNGLKSLFCVSAIVSRFFTFRVKGLTFSGVPELLLGRPRIPKMEFVWRHFRWRSGVQKAGSPLDWSAYPFIPSAIANANVYSILRLRSDKIAEIPIWRTIGREPASRWRSPASKIRPAGGCDVWANRSRRIHMSPHLPTAGELAGYRSPALVQKRRNYDYWL
jgi:hypothetical protein